jgi:hypothetical protein
LVHFKKFELGAVIRTAHEILQSYESTENPYEKPASDQMLVKMIKIIRVELESIFYLPIKEEFKND